MENLDTIIKQVITVLQENTITEQEKLTEMQGLICSRFTQPIDTNTFDKQTLKLDQTLK